MRLTETKFLQLIKQPASIQSLTKARALQSELQQFYANAHPQLILDKVKPWLTPKKYVAFENKSANHCQDLIDSVLTHYKKIYNASGRAVNIKFDGASAARSEIGFNDLRRVAFEGIKDNDYIKTIGHDVSFIEPNSVYLVGVKKAEETELDQSDKIFVKRFQLQSIHDVGGSARGIEYLIISERRKIDGQEITLYHCWDDVEKFTFKKSKTGTLLIDQRRHGMSTCPASFAYPENANIGDFVFKKSRFTDTIKDLYTYNILRTFYFVYKSNSAYTREIRAKTRCDHRTNAHYCDDGLLKSIDGGADGGECPACATNPGIMGEVIEIPLSQQANTEFLNNIPNLYSRQEADSNILKFHSDDVVDLKNEILDATIGKGFGQATRNQALNTDQVAINFDSQEANLDEFRDNLQVVYNFLLNRVGELYGNGFKSIDIFFGNKYFLKSTAQLYEELASVISSTSNAADIQQKQAEIVLTEHRHDEDFIIRHALFQALQPFALLGTAWVNENRDALRIRQPNAVLLYDNFNQTVQIFEAIHETRIERFGLNMKPQERLSKIGDELQRILKDNILSIEETPGTSGAAIEDQ